MSEAWSTLFHQPHHLLYTLDMLISNTANTDVTMSTNFVTFASFFWYFLVSTIAMPLTLTPATETVLRGILMERPTNVHLIAQRPCLCYSSKHLATAVNKRSWSISRAFCCTFLLAWKLSLLPLDHV